MIANNAIDLSEKDKVMNLGFTNPDLYLKNLSEYQKMLDLLSLNEHLKALLLNDDLLSN